MSYELVKYILWVLGSLSKSAQFCNFRKRTCGIVNLPHPFKKLKNIYE